ncbi:MAG: insulinase family protein [Candidatus Sumerlaeota bacterium]|nr:insulinase family protein [Candidatus Sumerlaeota bacterium]
MFIRRILSLLAAALAANCGRPATSGVTDYSLDNGLRVVLRPVSGTSQVALAMLYSVGEEHDPQGASGMGHLIEHLYATAASGKTPARDFEKYLARYPLGWNAQTSRDYTIMAGVFPKERLSEELLDAASRMSDLNIQPGDLAREIPRMENELANMYGGMPNLAAMNTAAGMAAPLPLAGARKGGIISQIKSIQVQTLRDRMKTYYKPRNAILVIAGAIDAEAAKQLVADAFARIESGQPIGKPIPAARPSEQSKTIDVNPLAPDAQSHAALAIRAPEPASPAFPAFLILTARLQKNAASLRMPAGAFPVMYAALDQPHVLFVQLAAKPGEDPEAVLRALKEYVRATCAEKLNGGDARDTVNAFGYPFNLVPLSDRALTGNLYGAAMCPGRMRQMGLDSERLAEKIKAVTDAELTDARDKFFSDSAIAAAIARVAQK